MMRFACLGWVAMFAACAARPTPTATERAVEPTMRVTRTAELRNIQLSSWVEPVSSKGEVWVAGFDFQVDFDEPTPVWTARVDPLELTLGERVDLPPLPTGGAAMQQVSMARLAGGKLAVIAGNRGWNIGGPVYLGVVAPGAPEPAHLYDRVAEQGGAGVVTSDGDFAVAAWRDVTHERWLRLAVIESDGRVSAEHRFAEPGDIFSMDPRALGLLVAGEAVYVVEPAIKHVVLHRYDRQLRELAKVRIEQPWPNDAIRYGRLSKSAEGLWLSLEGRTVLLDLSLALLRSWPGPVEDELSLLAHLDDGRWLSDNGYCARSLNAPKKRCLDIDRFDGLSPRTGNGAHRTHCNLALGAHYVRSLGHAALALSHCEAQAHLFRLE